MDIREELTRLMKKQRSMVKNDIRQQLCDLMKKQIRKVKNK